MKILLLILLAFSANAGMWSTVSTMNMKSIKPKSEYKIDTAGWNPRVYEFDTKSKPYMHCIVIFSSSNENSSPAMQCIKK